MRNGKSGRRLTALAVTGLGLGLAFTALAGARSATDTTHPTLTAGPLVVPATYDCFSTFCASIPISSLPLTVSDPDDAADQITITCNNPNGPMFFWGMSMLTCQAQDPAGNLSAPVMFTVSVTLPAPTFQNVPAPITTTATGQFGAVVTFVPPTATDVGGQAVTTTCDHLSGITYPIATTIVTCSATIQRNDSNGTPITGLPTATTQFTITVTPASAGGGGASSSGGSTSGGSISGGSGSGGGTSQDLTVPAIAPHPGLKVNATSPHGAAVTYVVTATDPDNTSGQLTTLCSPANGSTFSLGSKGSTKATTVICQSHDPAGNQATPISFTVTVLGGHDQLTTLERQVSSATTLTKARKQALASVLAKADRDLRNGAKTAAKTQLGLFIAQVGQLSRASRQSKGKWIAATARVIAVLG